MCVMLADPEQLAIYFSDNVLVSDGLLTLMTRWEPVEYDGLQYNFTSGWIDSSGLFSQQFGRFEISARLPGTW